MCASRSFSTVNPQEKPEVSQKVKEELSDSGSGLVTQNSIELFRINQLLNDIENYMAGATRDLAKNEEVLDFLKKQLITLNNEFKKVSTGLDDANLTAGRLAVKVSVLAKDLEKLRSDFDNAAVRPFAGQLSAEFKRHLDLLHEQIAFDMITNEKKIAALSSRLNQLESNMACTTGTAVVQQTIEDVYFDLKVNGFGADVIADRLVSSGLVPSWVFRMNVIQEDPSKPNQSLWRAQAEIDTGKKYYKSTASARLKKEAVRAAWIDVFDQVFGFEKNQTTKRHVQVGGRAHLMVVPLLLCFLAFMPVAEAAKWNVYTTTGYGLFCSMIFSPYIGWLAYPVLTGSAILYGLYHKRIVATWSKKNNLPRLKDEVSNGARKMIPLFSSMKSDEFHSIRVKGVSSASALMKALNESLGESGFGPKELEAINIGMNPVFAGIASCNDPESIIAIIRALIKTLSFHMLTVNAALEPFGAEHHNEIFKIVKTFIEDVYPPEFVSGTIPLFELIYQEEKSDRVNYLNKGASNSETLSWKERIGQGFIKGIKLEIGETWNGALRLFRLAYRGDEEARQVIAGYSWVTFVSLTTLATGILCAKNIVQFFRVRASNAVAKREGKPVQGFDFMASVYEIFAFVAFFFTCHGLFSWKFFKLITGIGRFAWIVPKSIGVIVNRLTGGVTPVKAEPKPSSSSDSVVSNGLSDEQQERLHEFFETHKETIVHYANKASTGLSEPVQKVRESDPKLAGEFDHVGRQFAEDTKVLLSQTDKLADNIEEYVTSLMVLSQLDDNKPNKWYQSTTFWTVVVVGIPAIITVIYKCYVWHRGCVSTVKHELKAAESAPIVPPANLSEEKIRELVKLMVVTEDKINEIVNAAIQREAKGKTKHTVRGMKHNTNLMRNINTNAKRNLVWIVSGGGHEENLDQIFVPNMTWDEIEKWKSAFDEVTGTMYDDVKAEQLEDQYYSSGSYVPLDDERAQEFIGQQVDRYGLNDRMRTWVRRPDGSHYQRTIKKNPDYEQESLPRPPELRRKEKPIPPELAAVKDALKADMEALVAFRENLANDVAKAKKLASVANNALSDKVAKLEEKVREGSQKINQLAQKPKEKQVKTQIVKPSSSKQVTIETSKSKRQLKRELTALKKGKAPEVKPNDPKVIREARIETNPIPPLIPKCNCRIYVHYGEDETRVDNSIEVGWGLVAHNSIQVCYHELKPFLPGGSHHKPGKVVWAIATVDEGMLTMLPQNVDGTPQMVKHDYKDLVALIRPPSYSTIIRGSMAAPQVGVETHVALTCPNNQDAGICNALNDRDEILYKCEARPGDCGAGIWDRDRQVFIGLHCAGQPKVANFFVPFDESWVLLAKTLSPLPRSGQGNF
jgi:hypothetical protein